MLPRCCCRGLKIPKIQAQNSTDAYKEWKFVAKKGRNDKLEIHFKPHAKKKNPEQLISHEIFICEVYVTGLLWMVISRHNPVVDVTGILVEASCQP